MERTLREIYEQLPAESKAAATFDEATLPFVLLQNYAYRLHIGNAPKKGPDGRIQPCSSDTLSFPEPVLLALQGVSVLNASLTLDRDQTVWEPVIHKVRKHLELKSAEGYINENTEREVVVATDGGCLGNGKASAVASWAYLVDNYVARSGLVPGFVLDRDLNVTQVPVSATNNRGELLAIVAALRLLRRLGVKNRICVLSDSEYAINVASKWMINWELRGELGSRQNADLVSLLLQVTAEIGRERIRYLHVAAHQTGGQAPSRVPNSADELSDEERFYLNARVDAMASAELRAVAP